jgi:hypothetical protein
MSSKTAMLLGAGLIVPWAAMASAEPGDLPAYTDAEKAGADFAVQGEYSGELASQDGPRKYGIQVIALGDGKFQAVVHRGGLPGDGWEKGDRRSTYAGETTNGATVFPGDQGEGRIADGVLTVTNSGGEKLGQLQRVERKSPTLGAKPPQGAIVLFDGTSADAFEGGKLTEDNLLATGCKSRDSFGSFRLHIEFRTPFMPTAQGQARGNSGVYLQDRYEFQVLDSFGLEGKDNECGGLYSIQAPRLNMCFPPLAWQTYDFDFTAPKFDEQGKKVANARVTLKHNGVLVYDDFEIPRLTPGGLSEEGPTGPIALQEHGNPVVYRNIWLVEKK